MPSSKAVKHYEEARLLQSQGKLSSAERAYRKAIKVDQNFVEAYNNLGNVLIDRDRLQEAAGAYRKAIGILPDHPMLLNNLGNALQLQGEYEKALGWFEKAIDRDSNYADAYVNLGSTLRNTGRQEKARESYRRATQIDPEHAGAFLNLGILLIELKEPDAAAASLEKAIALNPEDPVARLELGNALWDLKQRSGAMESYLQAVELDAGYADAYVRIASACQELGQSQKAEEHYRNAIALQPDHGAAYLGLSLLSRPDRDDGLLTMMEQQYRKLERSPKQQSQLGFALGNLYHQRKRYAEAFDYYALANRLQWSIEPYDLERELADMREIKRAFEPGIFERAGSCEATETTPVFIVGLPRSGKTLTEALLAWHPRVCDAGERHALRSTLRNLGDWRDPRALVEKLSKMSGDEIGVHARSYLNRMQRFCSGESFVINTMPINYYYIGFIRLLFPNAKVVHCSRHSLDVCWCIYRKAFANEFHRYSNDLGALAGYYKAYQELIEHWHSVLPGFMLDVRYEQLVSKPEYALSRLLSFVGLEGDGRSLEEYGSAFLHRHEIGCWRDYEPYLGPLTAALE